MDNLFQKKPQVSDRLKINIILGTFLVMLTVVIILVFQPDFPQRRVYKKAEVVEVYLKGGSSGDGLPYPSNYGLKVKLIKDNKLTTCYYEISHEDYLNLFHQQFLHEYLYIDLSEHYYIFSWAEIGATVKKIY